MDQCKCTTEGRTFQRLSAYGRAWIKALLGEGSGEPAIAAGIGGARAPQSAR
ncbi:MAG: hypothetical protein LBU32_32545 [Clostridiales bacterium]|nr:hypothetical protein [Clostridiales bacterium]